MTGLLEELGKFLRRILEDLLILPEAQQHRDAGQHLSGVKGGGKKFVSPRLQGPSSGSVGELGQGHDHGDLADDLILFNLLNKGVNLGQVVKDKQKIGRCSRVWSMRFSGRQRRTG